MNLRTSSMTRTGALRYKTACHSAQFSGVIWKRVYSIRSDLNMAFQSKAATYSEEWNI